MSTISPRHQKPYVKFAPKGTPSFYDTIKARANDYFETHNKAEHGNLRMYIKCAVMVLLYVLPFALIVTGAAGNSLFLFYFFWAAMSLGLIGIGVSVMHDANHGAFSGSKFINNLMGASINLVGAFNLNWKIQHNILHHTYTNLTGLDEDIEAAGLLRMSPQAPRKKIHRYQHLYAWFLYAIMNLYWMTAKDFLMLFRYEKLGLLRKQKKTLREALMRLTVVKVFYFGYILVLPMLFSGFAWYHVLLGFVVLQSIAGLALACIFQPAHVMETSSFAAPSDKSKMEHSWAEHQVRNTTNFCPNSVITSWFIGGLNYQIEHHLFPQVCHVHYPALSRIVKQTAQEFNLPYHVLPTFASAIAAHARALYVLGRNDQLLLAPVRQA